MPQETTALGDPQLASALAEVLKERLAETHSVQVPHLGTFEVAHKLSEIRQLEQGEIEMTPPQNAVTFQEKKSR